MCRLFAAQRCCYHECDTGIELCFECLHSDQWTSGCKTCAEYSDVCIKCCPNAVMRAAPGCKKMACDTCAPHTRHDAGARRCQNCHAFVCEEHADPLLVEQNFRGKMTCAACDWRYCFRCDPGPDHGQAGYCVVDGCYFGETFCYNWPGSCALGVEAEALDAEYDEAEDLCGHADDMRERADQAQADAARDPSLATHAARSC